MDRQYSEISNRVSQLLQGVPLECAVDAIGIAVWNALETLSRVNPAIEKSHLLSALMQSVAAKVAHFEASGVKGFVGITAATISAGDRVQ